MSKKHAVYYLVDTENPGGCQNVEELLSLKQKTRIYLFYSENTSKVAPSVVQKMLDAGSVHLIPVQTGKNSLDFCLISMAGYLAALHPKASFVILSDDHGYDSAIQMWQEYGLSMKREGTELLAGKKADKKAASQEDKAEKEAAGTKEKAAEEGKKEDEVPRLELCRAGDAETEAAFSEEDTYVLPERIPEVPSVMEEAPSPVILDGRTPSLPEGAVTLAGQKKRRKKAPRKSSSGVLPSTGEEAVMVHSVYQMVEEMVKKSGVTQLNPRHVYEALVSSDPQMVLTRRYGYPAKTVGAFFSHTDKAARRKIRRLYLHAT